MFKFFILPLILVLGSCSHTKYSGTKQYYKNFTSFYNTVFNVKQLYKKGYKKSVYNAQESTDQILSPFEFDNNPDLFATAGDFNGTTVKVSKLLHTKPHNKWMDDAILIEGKIRYLKGSYDSASILLNDVVAHYQKGYHTGHLPAGKLKWYDNLVRNAKRDKKPMKEPKFKHKFAKNEATIWLIKTYIKKEDFDKAQSLIFNAETDMSFPEEYRADLEKTKVMLAIANKELTGAKSYIQKALDYPLSKKEKSRMHFILGQLYEVEDNNALATTEYQYALDGKLSEDLKFEAKIRTLSLAQGNSEVAISELNRMLNKGIYQSKTYKIYYTLGNTYYTQNKVKEAMKNYELASQNAKTNPQKFLIFEKVASLSYKKGDYIIAAQYYDSALRTVPLNYPYKDQLEKKANALTSLLDHYKVYISKDSIMDLVALGKSAATKKIEQQLIKDKKEYEAKKEYDEAKILNETETSKPIAWYFSDAKNIEKGRIKFQKTWGKIKLQDNWKYESSPLNTALGNDKSNKNIESGGISAYDIALIEVDKLPFEKSAQKTIIAEIQDALVNMARIYHYDIKDINKAIETYETLYKKYPIDIANEDEILFSMFRLYIDKGDLTLAQEVKNKLSSKYPNSKYTVYANNPKAKSDEDKANQYIEKNYTDAYKDYKKANYSTALNTCISLIDEYPQHSLIPKVKLLASFIYSYTSKPAEQKTVLENIVASYTDTEEAKTAKELLDIINNKQTNNEVATTKLNNSLTNNLTEVKAPQDIPTPTTAIDTTTANKPLVLQKIEESTVSYTFDPYATHYTLFYLTDAINPNTVKTLLTVYSKTKWNSSNLTVESRIFGSHRIILVGNFENYEKATIYGNTAKTETMLKTLIEKSEIYTISYFNMNLLNNSSDWSGYVKFFNKNY